MTPKCEICGTGLKGLVPHLVRGGVQPGEAVLQLCPDCVEPLIQAEAAEIQRVNAAAVTAMRSGELVYDPNRGTDRLLISSGIALVAFSSFLGAGGAIGTGIWIGSVAASAVAVWVALFHPSKQEVKPESKSYADKSDRAVQMSWNGYPAPPIRQPPPLPATWTRLDREIDWICRPSNLGGKSCFKKCRALGMARIEAYWATCTSLNILSQVQEDNWDRIVPDTRTFHPLPPDLDALEDHRK